MAEAWPALAAELEHALRADGYPRLAATVAHLRVYDICRCGDWGCQSFDTVPQRGTWSRGGQSETIPLSSGVNVDVVDDETIVFVEVLRRRRNPQFEALARRFRGRRGRWRDLSRGALHAVTQSLRSLAPRRPAARVPGRRR